MEEIEKKLQELRDKLQQDKATVKTTERRIDILKAYRAMMKSGLKLGDRFQIPGYHFGQNTPRAIVTGMKKGNLIGTIIGVHDKLTKAVFVLYDYRLNDIVAMGEHPLGEPYRRPFDASALLEDGDL
jgi:hypothetical protein